MIDPPTATLPTSLSDNLSSIARIAMGGGSLWLVNHGLVSSSDAAELVNIGAGTVVAVAAIGWAYLKNRYFGKWLNTSAATGDPSIDPNSDHGKAAVAAAVANPNSPITAKAAS
jgi:hypothetical protein